MTGRFVYFIRPVGMNGPTKIGCSEAPEARLSQLHTWSPFPLEIVATLPGSLILEGRLHHRFLHLHSHREWFRASPEIDELIASVLAGTFDAAALPPPKRPRIAFKRSRESIQATTNGTKIGRLHKIGVPIPQHVWAAMHTYRLPAEEVSRRRAVVADFLAQRRTTEATQAA